LPPTHPQRGLQSEIGGRCSVIIKLRVIDTKVHLLPGYRETLLLARTTTVCMCGPTGEHSRRMLKKGRPLRLWFIWFVSFIWLVLFNQIHETNQTNQSNQPVLMLHGLDHEPLQQRIPLFPFTIPTVGIDMPRLADIDERAPPKQSHNVWRGPAIRTSHSSWQSRDYEKQTASSAPA
jgi:hypothetical protein